MNMKLLNIRNRNNYQEKKKKEEKRRYKDMGIFIIRE